MQLKTRAARQQARRRQSTPIFFQYPLPWRNKSCETFGIPHRFRANPIWAGPISSWALLLCTEGFLFKAEVGLEGVGKTACYILRYYVTVIVRNMRNPR